MNGRELIIYILKNNLEDEEVFSEEFWARMPSPMTVAIKFNVGVATVDTWIANKQLEAIEFNGKTYVTPESLRKFTEKVSRKEVHNA